MPVNGQAFLADYTSRMRVAHDRPTYKYMHVGIPHWPVSVNADCEYIGARSLRRPNYTDQARCGIRRVGAFLDKLRELGLYDSSLIVISSDHGVALLAGRIHRRARRVRRPAVRDVGQRAGAAGGEAAEQPPARSASRKRRARSATSRQRSSTRSDLKNPFPGTSALKLDEHAPRPRQFARVPVELVRVAGRFLSVHGRVHASTGRSTDGNAWKTEEPIYAPQYDSRRALARILSPRARRAWPDVPLEHAAGVSAPAAGRARRGIEGASAVRQAADADGRDARQGDRQAGAQRSRVAHAEVFDSAVEQRRRPAANGWCCGSIRRGRCAAIAAPSA